ncbi:Golgi-associated RAB2 interactor protein 1A-like [Anolis carolinensis]|uniref:Golgi-associated RAB2 interactor protein 1A-like n=1 Tax=Anolis carolinensis TaxID=28377 RepID=UPI002F2B90FF
MPKHSKGPSHSKQLPGADREKRKGKKEPRQGVQFWKIFTKGQPVRPALKVPDQTTLQKYLEKGEYPVFQAVPMFESNFFQVTSGGKHVFFHNHSNKAIVGIATTNVKLPLPNVLFIARPVDGQFSLGPVPGEPILTRALPLKFVRFSIHDPEKRVIKMRLINRRSYYLQLHAPRGEEKGQFDRWLSLVYLLHHPPSCYLSSRPKSFTERDNLSIDFISSDGDSVIAMFSKTEKNKGTADKALERRYTIDEGAKAEEYTEEMQEILRTLPVTSRSTTELLGKDDSYDTYEASVASKHTASSESFFSDLVLSSMGSLPSGLMVMQDFPFYQEREREEKKRSFNIITIYSAVSKTIAEGGKRKKSKK